MNHKNIYFFIAYAILSTGLYAQNVIINGNIGTSGNVVIGASNYHVSESIYTDAEIGLGNFITPATAINELYFFVSTVGANPIVNSYSIYLKDVPSVTTTFNSGVFTTSGYTLVFNGSINASFTGAVGVTFNVPYIRTAGTNLQMLLIRNDNVIHTGFVLDCAVGNNTSANSLSCRRNNNVVLPVSGITSLTASNFRPAIQLVHTIPPVLNIPNITLSKSIVPLGQTMLIQGQGFSPNGQVALNFFGAGGRYNSDLTANAQGKFTYTYNIPGNAQDGDASVVAWNANTNSYSSPVRNFELQISPANTPVDYLSITSQHSGASYRETEQIHFMWTDKLQRQYGNYFYPMVGTTAKRQYRYRIEYQVGSSGAWQLVNTIQGSAALNSVISLYCIVQINTANTDCRIRVIDDFVPSIITTTPVFAIAPVVSNLKVELVWDKTFTLPYYTYTSPIGVAADGVARLYVKVSKIDPNIGGALQAVSMSLSNGIHNSPTMLGKVKAATNIETYSTEANDASNIAATSSSVQNGAIWFWYVSPDDFSETDLTSYANEAERNVNIHILAQLSDGSQDNTDKTMIIVRPPLLMVHGLSSDESAWDKFNYGPDIRFITAPIFKQKKAINLSPNKSYDYNAGLILDPNTSSVTGGYNRLNSFQGNIGELRHQGFASNQVDYICHSMGGCVLRTAMTVRSNQFYGTSPNNIYKSYGKGFVHKAITINTPHNNTPFADAVAEFIPKANPQMLAALNSLYLAFPNFPLVFNIIQPDYSTSFKFEATDAVKNLQVSEQAGGKNLGSTTVKHHIIAGDVNAYSTQAASNFVELEPFFKVIHKVLKISHMFAVPPVKDILASFITATEIASVLPYIEWYSAQKGFPNFLGDGDVAVPLSSQLAGINQSSTTVSVFSNDPFTINANHIQITDRNDVGNKVKELLNSPIGGIYFGDIIPATGGIINRPLNNAQSSGNSYLPVFSYDTSKIKIISPDYNAQIYADSVLKIEFNLKDTIGLVYVDVNFQDQTITSFSRERNQIINTQIDPNFLASQLISVTAVYDIDSITYTHTDTIRTTVLTNDQLIGFYVDPKVVELRENTPFYPNYSAIYNTSITGVYNSDPAISVTLADPTVVQYNQPISSFMALSDTGSTYAVIRYNGFEDTLYFINTSNTYSGCINKTLANGNLNNVLIWEKGTVPSTCDSVVVMPGHTLIIDTSVQIRALNIIAGGTVILADSTVRLQIGAEDDGGNSFVNNGTLIINKGILGVNGFIKQNTGSSFEMTGGEIIIDGNTSYESTSVKDGENLFDISDNMISFSFTGGTLQIVDPPLSENSQAIKCIYDFGDQTILKFGNGISATASNNVNGFGGLLMPAKIGQLIIDATNIESSRLFNNVKPLIIKQRCHLLSGYLIQTESITIEQ